MLCPIREEIARYSAAVNEIISRRKDRNTCHLNCRDASHADRIVNAIRSIDCDVELADRLPQVAAFLVTTCRNFARVANNDRVTALHAVAESKSVVNLAALAELLILHQADVNLTVLSNGWTPLHYACASHNMAVVAVLCRNGANLHVFADQYRVAADVVPHPEEQHIGLVLETEVWAWGHIRDGNVGLVRDSGDNERPQPLQHLNRMNVNICKAAIGPYHSMFIDDLCRLFVVGSGHVGNLGIDSVYTIHEPTLVKLRSNSSELSISDQVIAVSVSRYTSMVLNRRNEVYTCGTNKYGQLCHDVNKITKFTLINVLRFFNLTGISSKEKYSLTWDQERMWIWGTNVGQCGYSYEDRPILTEDDMLRFESGIQHVGTSEFAIAVGYKRAVLVMNNYKKHKVNLPANSNLKGITLDGSKATEFVQLIVMADDMLMLWRSDVGIMEVVRPFEGTIKQVLRFCDNELHYISRGHVYRSCLQIRNIRRNNRAPVDPYSYSHDKLYMKSFSTAELINVECKPLLHNVQDVYCDADGKTFVAMPLHSKRYLLWPERPDDDQAMSASVSALLSGATVDDGTVDVVFALSYSADLIGAHRFVLLQRAPKMQWLLQLATDGRPAIVRCPKWLTLRMMRMILRFVYDKHVMTAYDAIDILDSVGPDNKYDADIAYKEFCKFCKLCGLHGYTFPRDGTMRRYEPDAITFSRIQLPELHDVTLLCGSPEVAVRAHKCILTARSEYFRMMFSHSWTESQTNSVRLPQVPIDSMLVILEHLYHSDDITRHQYSDSGLCTLAQICSQMLLDDMVTVLECKLIDRITAKKCVDLLGFAVDVQLHKLREQCLRFMYTNFGEMMERRVLDSVEPDIVLHFKQYCHANLIDQIPKLSKPLTVDELNSVVRQAQVDLSDVPKPMAKKQSADRPTSRVLNPPPLLDNVRSNESALSAGPTPTSAVVLEAALIADELCEKFATWSTVSGKREAAATATAKRALSSVHANEVLAQESKSDEAFVRLNHCDEEVGSEFERMPVNLGLFSPDMPTKRMSQRERKRQSSQSENGAAAVGTTNELGAVGDSPLANVWALRNPQLLTPDKPQSVDGDSVLFTPEKSKTSNKTKKSSSFASIQKQEQREKDILHRILNKPLWMTQAEEKALVELRTFYNVENVFDERIVVERVPPELSTSHLHSVWYL